MDELDLLQDDINIGEEGGLSRQVVEDAEAKTRTSSEETPPLDDNEIEDYKMEFIHDYLNFAHQKKRKYILKRPVLEQIFYNLIVPLEMEIDRQGKTPELIKSLREINTLVFGKRTSKRQNRIKLLLRIPVYNDYNVYRKNKSPIARVSRTRYGGKKRKGKRKTKRKRRKKTKKGKGKGKGKKGEKKVRMDRTKKRKRFAIGIAPNEDAKIATRKLYENIKREELEKRERNKTLSRLYAIDTELARYFPDRVRTYPEEENEVDPAVKVNE